MFLNLFLSFIVATVVLFLPSYENPQIPFTSMTFCKKLISFQISYKVEVAGCGPRSSLCCLKGSFQLAFPNRLIYKTQHCCFLRIVRMSLKCLLQGFVFHVFSIKPYAKLNSLTRLLPNASQN